MAAIALADVSIYPLDGSDNHYVGGPQPRERSVRRLKITGVTAADTATAAVLGFSRLYAAHSGFDDTDNSVFPIGIDPVNNLLYIGAGPSNDTVYLIVEGSPIPPQ